MNATPNYADMSAQLDQDALATLLKEGKLALCNFITTKPLGEQPVFDIEIAEPDGLFACNDLVVHNCKESLLARGFTQMDFEEGTGIIRVKTDEREPFEIPSKARVKFYDTQQERIVIGPLSVAVANAFPIATDSLEKLRAGELYRVLAD